MKRIPYNIILTLVFGLSSSCAREIPVWKSVTFYNADNSKIELKSFKGVNMYHGYGPSDYGNTILHPNIPGSMDTRLDVEFSYPIQAVYRVLGSDDEYTIQEILSVENVDSNVIDTEGTLVALFKDGSFRLIFFKGVSGFSKQDLDRMYGTGRNQNP